MYCEKYVEMGRKIRYYRIMQELGQGAALTDEVRQQIVDFAKTALEKFRRAGGR